MNGLTGSKSSQSMATHKKSGRSKEKRKSKHKLKKRVSSNLMAIPKQLHLDALTEIREVPRGGIFRVVLVLFKAISD